MGFAALPAPRFCPQPSAREVLPWAEKVPEFHDMKRFCALVRHNRIFAPKATLVRSENPDSAAASLS
jgi:hypothetical protein